MKEYIRHIEEYYNYSFSSFSSLVPESNWGNKELAEKYLEKYWLPEQEYQSIWKSIQDNIFIYQDNIPDLMFASYFEIISLTSGCLFTKDSFEKLQKAIKIIGETHFVVIQSTQDFTEGEPMFKMKFPVNISWDELISGNYISAVLLEMNYNEYFVFGASGKWGKYSATEHENPIDVIGFKSMYAQIFKKLFSINTSII